VDEVEVTAAVRVGGLVRSAWIRCSWCWSRFGMGFEGSRMPRQTVAPEWCAVRAAMLAIWPVGPKTMTLGEGILVFFPSFFFSGGRRALEFWFSLRLSLCVWIGDLS